MTLARPFPRLGFFSRSNATTDIEEDEVPQQNTTVEQSQVTRYFDNPRLLPALKDLIKLSYLDRNWDGYGSPPITSDAFRNALLFLSLGDRVNAPIPYIGPVTGGGIQMEWHTLTRELEVEILPDGSLEYVLLNEVDEPREGSLTGYMSEVQDLIRWVMRRRSKYDRT